MSSYGLGRNFSAPTGADAFTYKATQDVARSGEYKEMVHYGRLGLAGLKRWTFSGTKSVYQVPNGSV